MFTKLFAIRILFDPPRWIETEAKTQRHAKHNIRSKHSISLLHALPPQIESKVLYAWCECVYYITNDISLGDVRHAADKHCHNFLRTIVRPIGASPPPANYSNKTLAFGMLILSTCSIDSFHPDSDTNRNNRLKPTKPAKRKGWKTQTNAEPPTQT